MRPLQSGITRFRLALFAVALIAAGCGSDRGDPQIALHEAVAVGEPYVVLQLRGVAVNREPEAYESVIEDLPVAGLVPEGSMVKPGDMLLQYDAQVIEGRTARRQTDVRVTQARLQWQQMQSGQQIAALDSQRQDLEHEQVIVDARMEATRRRDESELNIAAVELKRAQQTLAHAEQHRKRLRALPPDLVKPADMRQAEDACELAGQAVRLPQMRLEYLQSYTGSTSRRLFQIDRDALSVELGDEEHREGIFGQIEGLRHKQQLHAIAAGKSLNQMRLHNELEAELMADNVMRARTAGVLKYREGGLRISQRLPGSSAMFVLRQEDMGFAFDLPVRWRNLIGIAGPDDPHAGRVDLDAPQLGVAGLVGRVESISVLAYPSRSGRAYRCQVRLGQPLAELREGMFVDCAMRVVVPEGALSIPAWTVRDPGDPWVTMADGSKRPVKGQLIGHRFVVFEGLTAGEKVRARGEPDPADRVRLRGVVRPVEARQLNVSRKTEIIEMVPEGSFVEKGAVIATLSYATQSSDKEAEWVYWAKNNREKAATELAIARVEAEAVVSKAYVAWHKAVLAVDRSRLESLIARYVSFDEEQTAGDVELHRARIAWRAAEHRLVEAQDASAAGTLAAQQLRDVRLKRDHARIAHDAAKLEAVAALRQRDWIAVWEEQEEAFAAEEAAEVLRYEYSLQRENLHLILARALDTYLVTTDRVHQILAWLDNVTVHAPIAGRVYYNVDTWTGRGYRQLKTGRRLRTTCPFFIPVDLRREVRVEVPVRFHGRFEKGQHVPVQLSVLSLGTVEGTVSSISHHFHPSELTSEELITRANVGPPPMVFTMTIALSLNEQEAEAVRPGVTAWLELDL